jgi:hypothetical protein
MDGNGYPDIVRTSTSDNNVYILYTRSTGSSALSYSPDLEYQLNATYSATVSGSKGDLAAVDNKYEQLTEVYLNYPNQTLLPQNRGGNVLSDLDTSWYNDSRYYVVDQGLIMDLYGYSPDIGYQGKTVSKAMLQIKLTTTTYSGASFVQYSIDGVNWFDTTIKPGAE